MSTADRVTAEANALMRRCALEKLVEIMFAKGLEGTSLELADPADKRTALQYGFAVGRAYEKAERKRLGLNDKYAPKPTSNDGDTPTS